MWLSDYLGWGASWGHGMPAMQTKIFIEKKHAGVVFYFQFLSSKFLSGILKVIII